MSISSQASLGSIRQQAMEVSDNEVNAAISVPAWNSFITNSYKRLYELLVGAYSNNYYVAQYYQFTLGNSQFYSLPDGTATFQNTSGTTAAKFFKLLGVDLQYSGSPSGWVTLRRFELIERNKNSWPNTTINNNGMTNLRYSIQGDQIMFMPAPMASQQARLLYVPAPTNLQYRLNTNVVGSVSVLIFPDTTGLTVGMNVFGNGIASGTTIAGVGSTSIGLSSSTTGFYTQSLISMWDDSTLMDGISGWEEFCIVDSALKANNKQENDVSVLGAQRAELIARIEAIAEGRDIGEAFHTSDVLAANSWGGGSFDGGSGSGDGWNY